MTLALGLAWVVTVGSLAGLLWWLTRLAQRRRRSRPGLTPMFPRIFRWIAISRWAGLLADDDLGFYSLNRVIALT